MQASKIVKKAYSRINNYVYNTPLVYSKTLNKMLGGSIYFKMDSMQRTKSFKLRGVLNYLLDLSENHKLPNKIVSYSTGNHAFAIFYSAKLFGIHARVYLPENVSPVKKKIAEYYGAEIIKVKTRSQAEELSLKDSKNGFHYLHPSDNDQIIAGAGTMCYEALIHMTKSNILPDAIFASCGGGGLLAGSYLAKELLSPSSMLIGTEPEIADDAYRSLKLNKIQRFNESPNTIADGLRALSICERTFSYLKKLDGFYTCSEKSIYYWTTWLMNTMRFVCEPSGSIALAAAYHWFKNNNDNANKRALILISGGNVDTNLYLGLPK